MKIDKSYERIVENGLIAQNEQFHLFINVFYAICILNFLHSHSVQPGQRPCVFPALKSQLAHHKSYSLAKGCIKNPVD